MTKFLKYDIFLNMNLFNILCPLALKNAFESYDLRLVGGCVRDWILGVNPQDIDFAINIPPDKVIEILKKANIPFFTTGINFGTVTAVIDHQHFEITSLREEILHQGRHPKVIYTTSFEKDALRRDFTFNSIYIDKNGDIFDPFFGVDDLKQGIVRFIGDPLERIKEDPLRILRLYRFFGKTGKTICEKSRKAVRENMHLIHIISKERIWDEIKKIIKLARNFEILSLLKEDMFFTTETISDHLKDLEDPHPITVFCSLHCELKFNWNKKDQSFYTNLLNFKENSQDILYLSLFHPKDFLTQLLCLRFLNKTYSHSEFQQQKSRLENYTPPLFPLKGDDLITQGIQKGPQIREILTREKEKWARNIINPNS